MFDGACRTKYRPVFAALRELRAVVVKYRSPEDVRILQRAYRFARNAHSKQNRRSGEPYISHPVAVTTILAGLDVDLETLIAGLLHDVVEDTGITVEEVAAKFGQGVAGLVDGVTKLKIVVFDEFGLEADKDADADAGTSPQAQARAMQRDKTAKDAANLRKIFIAMSRDLRVMVIKLADRLHNMRTLESMAMDKRKRIADETLQVFAPLAHRLGIWQIKWELEDLGFKYAEPEAYNDVKNKVAQTRGDRQIEVDTAVEMLKKRLVEEGISDAHVMGRPKHLYSIYNKMLKQELDFKELFDLVALRVVVHTKPQCYHALGIVSGLWTPIPGMYSDYIAHSKSNMYQSLHLKVMGPHGSPIEVQIRTWEMHRTSEFGVAAHWAYKEKGEGGRVTDQFERKLNWLRQQIFDLQAESKEPGEFLRNVREHLFADQVFVMTPKGDVFDLPAGATPIDFAYRIHTDVGNKLAGARVNGKHVTLAYMLKNGDVVEIYTRSDAHPSRDWLALTKTPHARSKIKAHLKRLLHDDNVIRGRESLGRELEKTGLDPRVLLKDDMLQSLASVFNLPNGNELLAGVGYGSISLASVVNRLQPAQPLMPKGVHGGKGKADESKLSISAGDVDNVMVRRARCCMPIPGDDIIGYVTRGRGMALHRMECVNVRHYEKTEPERLTRVDYKGGETQVFGITIILESEDRTGLIADVGHIFGEQKTFITSIKTQSHPDKTATLQVNAEVRDVTHFNRLVQALRRMQDVLDIVRPLSEKTK